jgi:hypothetical protein
VVEADSLESDLDKRFSNEARVLLNPVVITSCFVTGSDLRRERRGRTRAPQRERRTSSQLGGERSTVEVMQSRKRVWRVLRRWRGKEGKELLSRRWMSTEGEAMLWVEEQVQREAWMMSLGSDVQMRRDDDGLAEGSGAKQERMPTEMGDRVRGEDNGEEGGM